MGQQPADLSEEERLAEYRRKALLARCRALNCKYPELRDSYNALATLWDTLANGLQPPPRSRPKDWLAATQKLAVTDRH